jgi:putative endonuclease
MSAQVWWVYMIRTSDGQLYTGITTDMQRRWREHCSGKGGARYFRTRRPQAICFLETHSDRSSASKREAQIKAFSKTSKEALVAASQPVAMDLAND